MRETESSPVFVTQTEPLSAATAPGDDPTGTEAAIRPDPESIAPTESAPTPASAVSPELPPSAKTGMATAAAITPASAASNSERRRRGACLTSSAPRSGGNSTRSPSATTCEIRSGRSTSFRRYEPRSRRKTPGGRSSSTSSRVEDDRAPGRRGRWRRCGRRDAPRSRRSARPRRPPPRNGCRSARRGRRRPATRGRRAPAGSRPPRQRHPRRCGRRRRTSRPGCRSPRRGSPRTPPVAAPADRVSSSPYRSRPSRLSRAVEPSMSVNRKVTVPLRRSAGPTVPRRLSRPAAGVKRLEGLRGEVESKLELLLGSLHDHMRGGRSPSGPLA